MNEKKPSVFMLGLAQKLFLEKTAKALLPWEKTKKAPHQWPLLNSLIQAKRLNHVDLALAKHLLQSIPEAPESIAAFICHLSQASRQGHLCVTINQDVIYPAVESVWIPTSEHIEEKAQDISEKFHELSILIKNAVYVLPATLLHEIPLITDQATLNQHALPSLPLCKHGSHYYLQRYWVLESQFLKHLLPLITTISPSVLKVDEESVLAKVESLLDQNSVLPEQGKAIIHGCLNPLTVITGGPGTGKTHTAGLLLKVFWESLNSEQRHHCRIGLAAPTGKAAANLESSIHRALKEVAQFPMPTAQTLHTLLGIGKLQGNNAARVLPYDVLLIDECSMIDVQVMGQLLAAIKPGTRLIMLGDRYQLPSVEAGSVFADLVSLLQQDLQNENAVVELKTCLRAELRSIVDLAKSINEGREEDVKALFKHHAKEDGIAFTPIERTTSIKEQQRQLVNYGSNKFPYVDSLDNPAEILKIFSQFRILTPLRKGFLGVEALNALFLNSSIKKFQKRKAKFFVAPIMIVHNDHRQELFNGEVGLLIRPMTTFPRHQQSLDASESGSYALFIGKALDNSSSQIRKISALKLPKYEFAYCLSVHKSQGSEFDHVLMLLPEGSEHFGREVLYTGVTRARKHLEIWSTPDTLSSTIKKVSRRHSGTAERIANIRK